MARKRKSTITFFIDQLTLFERIEKRSKSGSLEDKLIIPIAAVSKTTKREVLQPPH